MKNATVRLALVASLVSATSAVFAASLLKVDEPAYQQKDGLKPLTEVLQKNLTALNADGSSDSTAIGLLQSASNSLNSKVGSLQTSTGTLNSAVGTLQSATNALNAKLAAGANVSALQLLKADGTTATVYFVSGVLTNSP